MSESFYFVPKLSFKILYFIAVFIVEGKYKKVNMKIRKNRKPWRQI